MKLHSALLTVIQSVKRFKMTFTVLLLLALSQLVFGQESYSVVQNRLTMSGIVNQDTFLVESIQNQVQFNQFDNNLEIIYNTDRSRNVTPVAVRYTDSVGTVEITFFGNYEWMLDQLKSNEPASTMHDEITVRINGMEMQIPVDFLFNQLRGTQGYTSRMTVTGNFNPADFGMNKSGFTFIGSIAFEIFVTFQISTL